MKKLGFPPIKEGSRASELPRFRDFHSARKAFPLRKRLVVVNFFFSRDLSHFIRQILSYVNTSPRTWGRHDGSMFCLGQGKRMTIKKKNLFFSFWSFFSAPASWSVESFLDGGLRMS